MKEEQQTPWHFLKGTGTTRNITIISLILSLVLSLVLKIKVVMNYTVVLVSVIQVDLK